MFWGIRDLKAPAHRALRSYSTYGHSALATHHTDSTGDEQFEVVLSGEFKDVVETIDVDPDREWNVRLADYTQQCAEMHQPINTLVHHQLL